MPIAGICCCALLFMSKVVKPDMILQHVDRRPPGPAIKSITFTDSRTCWLLKRDGSILVTSDGGQTWSSRSIRTSAEIQCVTFLRSGIGWAIDRNTDLWKSTDAGTNWRVLTNLRTGSSTGPFEQILFIDEVNGWLVDPFSLWRTNDGGNSWQRHFFQIEGKELTHFYFAMGNQTGWLGGENGVLYITTDGGHSWRGKAVGSKDMDLSDIFFLNAKAGWFSAWPHGGIFHTTDGGDSWTRQAVPVSEAAIDSISFIGALEGWAAGGGLLDKTATEYTGLILHTTDGGRAWQRVETVQIGESFKKVFFADRDHGWLSTDSSVYRTTNRGLEWERVLKID